MRTPIVVLDDDRNETEVKSETQTFESRVRF